MGLSRSQSAKSILFDDEQDDPRAPIRRPETRLWFHVLRRQIWDFVLYRSAPKDSENYFYAVDAAGWLWWDGEEEADEYGRPTFLHVCHILDLDPSMVREVTLALSREDISRLNNQIKDGVE